MNWKTQAVKALTRQGAELARQARKSEALRQGVAVAGSAAAAMPIPVRFIAQRCAVSGVAGAMFEGAQGARNAHKAYKQGRIDERQAGIHTAAEAGCGFVTSSAGMAAALGALMLGAGELPMILIASTASVGARHLYKTVVGETLPEGEGASDGAPDAHQEEAARFEHIGPT